MARKFAEIAFTPAVKVAQTRYGSRAGASKLEQGEMISGDRLGEMQAAFIAARYTSDEIGRLPTVAPNHG
tara:strand:+ start:169 stop:378 length:210 start_codon:yes stop_codon:yes gene_type:complete